MLDKGKIIPFEITHLKQMNIKEVDYRDIDLETYRHHEGKYSYTVLLDNHPIICAGIIPIANGVGEVWTVSDKEIERHPLAAHKSILKLIKVMEELNFHRLQAICSMLGNSGKWLELLGFNREGTMKQFGPNKEDYYLYARIK